MNALERVYKPQYWVGRIQEEPSGLIELKRQSLEKWQLEFFCVECGEREREREMQRQFLA